ncbi:MAG: hypothetical protein WC842_00785 [Candidatus Paceibacterota bacterium]|jgi:hypothetical protein
MKQPKNDSKYIWTTHAWEKMQQYGISEQRVKRIVRFPKRTEEGVLDGAVAVMSPCGRSAVGRQPSHTSEMWVMYVLFDGNQKGISPACAGRNDEIRNPKQEKEKKNERPLDNIQSFLGNTGKRFKIITVWRYPGVSPVRDAIPDDVLSEIRALL